MAPLRAPRSAAITAGTLVALLGILVALFAASVPAGAISQPGAIGDDDWNASFDPNATWPPTDDAGWPTPATNPGIDARCGIDIGVIIDRSGSIANAGQGDNYKAAVKDLVDAFAGTPSKVGFWSFATHASDTDTTAYPWHQIVPLNGPTGPANVVALKAGVDSIPIVSNFATNWEEGLRAPLQNSVKADPKPDLYLVLTDGFPTVHADDLGSGGSTDNDDMAGGVASANLLKADGRRVLAVGVGPNVSVGGLKLISGPTDFNGSNISTADYLTSSFKDLSDSLVAFANAVCGIDLSVSKTDGKTTTNPGEVNSYTVGFDNSGTVTATNVTLHETVPANTTYVATGSSAWSCADGSTAGTSCDLNVGSVDSGDGGSAIFKVKVDNPVPAGVTQIVNTVTITGEGKEADTEDQTATDTDNLVAAPALTVEKSDDDVTVAPGDTLEYDIAYANTGNIGDTGVVLHETVPDHTTFNAAESEAGWDCTGTAAGSTCTLDVGGLAVDGVHHVTFAVDVDDPLSAGVTTLHNAVVIDDNRCEVSCDDDDEDTPVDAAPDLTVQKDDGGITAEPGDDVTYTLDYANVGDQDATGVVLTETVPDGSTFVGPAGWTCVDTTCTFAVGDVAAGDSGSVDFTVKVDDPFPDGQSELNNVVVIADDGENGDDPTPENNTDDDQTPVEIPEVSPTTVEQQPATTVTVLGEVVQALPKTGSNVGEMLQLGGVLLLAGGVAVLAADATKRRRRAV